MTNSHLLPPSDDPGFPTALAAARQARGFSAAGLARLAGISPTMVARYENITRADHHRPRSDTVARLEQVLRNKTAGRSASAAAAQALEEATPSFTTIAQVMAWARERIAEIAEVKIETIKLDLKVEY